jgi:hypothetical protein
MVEQVAYRVVTRHPGWEHRHYDDYALVSVDVTGGAEVASYLGFRPLFQFISGANDEGAPIAMTAPVFQESPSPTTHRVSFAMPASMSDSVPTPTNSRLVVEKIPAHDAAALTFRGSWSARKVEQKTEELLREMAKEGLTPSGPARFARYDPPYKPPVFRRNEVIIPC